MGNNANSDTIEINPVKIGLGIIAVLAVLTVVLGSWFTVDQGERVVLLTNGAISSVKGPGIYFKAPFIQSTAHFSIRTAKSRYEGIETYSKDVQEAHTTVTVNHSIDPAKVGDLYQTLGADYENTIVTPAVLSTLKNVFGQYSATESIDTRQKLVEDMQSAITTKLQPYGIKVENVSIEDISFSKAFNDSVEARMQAEIQVQQAKQTLLQEQINADIVRTKAQGAADASVATAKGQAAATKLAGDAEASAITAKANALKENSNLVNLTIAQKWNGELPTTMLPGGSTPLLNLSALQAK